MEPFIRPGLVVGWLHLAQRRLTERLTHLRAWSTRIHLSLDIQAPSLLMPQKLASPNLIILNMGEKFILYWYSNIMKVHIPWRLNTVFEIVGNWILCYGISSRLIKLRKSTERKLSFLRFLSIWYYWLLGIAGSGSCKVLCELLWFSEFWLDF